MTKADLVKGYQFWLNPVDKKVYAGVGEPSYGFNSSDNYFFPVYNVGQRLANESSIRVASKEGIEISSLKMKSPWEDEEWRQMYLENLDKVRDTNAKIRTAALTSAENTAVQILNVFPKMYGLKDRRYGGRYLAEEIAVPNLVIDIDTLRKYSGMTQIGELMLPFPKEIRYTRAHYEAKKYGLLFEISQEAMLKNIHNPMQDSITVASTKLDQRISYDIVSTLESGLTSIAGLGDWGAFTSNTDHSTVNPKKDITRIVTTSIEATGIGGTFNRVGMHSVTVTDYESNSFIRGLFAPAPDPNWVPALRSIKGLDGVALAQDYFIPQGVCYVLDVGDQTCCALFQGPTRVASKMEEISGSQIYGIFDFHLAAIINSLTGVRMTGIATPVAPA